MGKKKPEPQNASHICSKTCFHNQKEGKYIRKLETVHYGWFFTEKHQIILLNILSLFSIEVLLPIFKSYLIDENSNNYPSKASFHTFIRKDIHLNPKCQLWLAKHTINNEYPKRFKVVVFGDHAVGKSALVLRYITGWVPSFFSMASSHRI